MKKLQRGFSLIELMITIGLMAVLLPGLFLGFATTRSGRAQAEQRQQAIAIAKEGEEAARVVEEADWQAFSALSTPANTPYYLTKLNNTWALSTTDPGLTPGFIRIITISDVYRDFTTDPANAPIVDATAPGATLDPSTKKVTTSVSWTTPIAATETVSEYITRQTNLSYTETTQAQFDLGTKTGVVTTNDSGGEVKLGAGSGSGNWCAPTLTLATADLPKSGVANAIYAIEGTVFAGTGDNASGVSFQKVGITTTYPPITTLQSTYDGFKTNGVFGEANYAYLATDTNSKEIDIINLNSVVSGKYQEAGWFDAPGNGTGNSVYVYGNIGFMTDGSKLYTFDLSSKTGSRPLLGSANLIGGGVTGKRVFVIQDPNNHNIYAFVATTNTASQLQIFQVSSDGKTITSAGSKGLTAQGAVDLFVSSDGSRVYLTTAYTAGQSNVFVLDTTNKSAIPAPLSSTNTGGMTPKGITFIQNRIIVVGTGGTYQYQVFQVNSDIISNCDATDPSKGKLTIGTGVNGVSSVFQSNGDAYSYIITGDASSELKVIRGGAGGAGGTYAAAGIFESKTFDTGHTVAFNYFSVHDQTVSGTTSISYQIAIKPGLTGGSCAPGTTCCANVTFSSSDFTSNNFTPPTALPFKTVTGYTNPGQCLRYRANLATTDTSQTPILNDVTINYSP